MATYLEQSLAKLKEFEGCVPWMYRDTVGKVTVGVGLMLPSAAAATALPFTRAGRDATTAEIAADFARVTTMAEGKAAEFYRLPTSPELAQPTIDTKLLEVLEAFEGRLRVVMTGYDAFPEGVKLALLDMAYNLGPAGLVTGYPRLLAAIEQRHWALAATESVRHGPSAARNAWTKEQFLTAVVGTIKAETEGLLNRLWRRVRAIWR
jgi:GH24 family phage-related lysozyme (muramidase)